MCIICKDTKKAVTGVWLVSGQVERSYRKVTGTVLDRKV